MAETGTPLYLQDRLKWMIYGLSETFQVLHRELFQGTEDDVIEHAVELAEQDAELSFRIEGPSAWDSIRIEQDDNGDWIAVCLVPDLIHRIPVQQLRRQQAGAA